MMIRSIAGLALYVLTLAASAADPAIRALPDEVAGSEPSTLYGNTSQNVTLCTTDGVGSPIPGITMYFWFYGGGYSGQVNGMGSGNYTPPTGSNGCVTVTVVTTGLQPTPPTGSPTHYVRFSFVYQNVPVQKDFHFIVNDPTLSLSTYHLDAVPAPVTVTINPPYQGINIVVLCQGTGGASPSASPAVSATNSQGKTTFTVNGSNLEVVNPGGPQPTASSTFKTQTGGVNSATLTVRAVNVCTIGLSPADPRCG